MELQIQYFLFFYSILIGIYLGVTYDLLYYFVFMYLKKALKYTCDILFFICQAFIVYQVIYNINSGIIPFYCYLLMGLGFLIYYNFAQKFYQQQIYPLRKTVFLTSRKVIKILHYLFVKPFSNTYHFFNELYLYVKKIFIKLFKKIKKSNKK